MKSMMKDEMERLSNELKVDEEKIRKKYEDEYRKLEEHVKQEFLMQKNYIQNCTEIEVGKAKEALEQRIEEITKNRYANLNVAGSVVPASGMSSEQVEIDIEKEIAAERDAFNQACRARRQRFDKQMQVLLHIQDNKRINYLKKEILPLIKTKGTVRIADESILESRYKLKITRNAIRSGASWALYRAKLNGQPVICKVTVLSKMPVDIRNNLDNAYKCYKFLNSKESPHFVKLHEIFQSDQKVYVVLDEVDPTSWQMLMRKKERPAASDLKNWYIQICDAIRFMHNYAIAHLNLRSENIVFDNQQNAKLVGFSHAYCFFNLDQEKFVMAPKIRHMLPLHDHMPPEAFDSDYYPDKADIWSFGYLIYETETRQPPRRVSTLNKKVDHSQYRAPKFVFDKIGNPAMRELVPLLTDPKPMSRPHPVEIMLEYLEKY